MKLRLGSRIILRREMLSFDIFLKILLKRSTNPSFLIQLERNFIDEDNNNLEFEKMEPKPAPGNP